MLLANILFMFQNVLIFDKPSLFLEHLKGFENLKSFGKAHIYSFLNPMFDFKKTAAIFERCSVSVHLNLCGNTELMKNY